MLVCWEVRVSTSILAAGGLVVVVMVVVVWGAEGTLLRFLSPNTGRGVRLRRVNSYRHNRKQGYSPAAHTRRETMLLEQE